MMGDPVGQQDRLFYEYCLEDLVPPGHLLGRIDAVLDLSWLRGALKPYYSAMGRPSVCPELMVRMLVVGYCYSIRSERRLCQEVEFNLAYRWFCRLGLEDQVPDHSTFSVNRHGRFRESDILRQLFEEVVCGCMKAGLIGGEGFAVDASVIEADASRFQRVEGARVDWTSEQRTRRPKIAESDPALWWKTVEVNVRGPYLVTRFLLAGLADGAKIINLSSGVGLRASDWNSSYHVSKAGLHLFTEALSNELWPRRIDVNNLIPGPVATNWFNREEPDVIRTPEEILARFAEELPPGFPPQERLKHPDEVAELALYMATLPVGGPTGQTFSLARRSL